MSDREELFEILERASVNAATALTAKDKEIEALRERVGLLKGCYDQAVECSLEWKARAETAERRVKDVSKSRDFYVGLCQELRSLAETVERERDEARAALKECAEALSRCYEVCDWPADGTTRQDGALRAARAVIKQGE